MRKVTATLCLILAVLLESTRISASADYEKDSAAFKRGDYQSAPRVWKTIAEFGNVFAHLIWVSFIKMDKVF